MENMDIITLEDLRLAEDKYIQNIRNGFKEVVIAFIDMVDSSKFKIDNEGTPEIWILRLWQFSNTIKEYVIENNGRVVKYIGDEVMVLFEKDTKFEDAMCLTNINYLEDKISKITKEKAQLKIAIDTGLIYFITYDTNNTKDPQGTPVDRCARIAKECNPGTILASNQFVDNCTPDNKWNIIGTKDFKGLGVSAIYQHGDPTVMMSKYEPISKHGVRELFINSGKFTEKMIDDDLENIFNQLNRRGLNSEIAINRLLRNEDIFSSLRELYTTELLRDSEPILDPGAIATWGADLQINGIGDVLVEDIRRRLRLSDEYRRKHNDRSTGLRNFIR